MSHDLPNCVELLEAREDHHLIFAAYLHRHELADHVDQDRAGEDSRPPIAVTIEIGDTMLALDIRVTCAAVASPIKRKKSRLAVLQPRGHRYVVFIDGEVNERAALEGQQRFVGRRTILAILFLGVPKGGSGEFVLQLEGRDRDAVDEDHDVDRVLIAAAVMDLSRDRENVGFVASLESRVDVRGRLEGT